MLWFIAAVIVINLAMHMKWKKLNSTTHSPKIYFKHFSNLAITVVLYLIYLNKVPLYVLSRYLPLQILNVFALSNLWFYWSHRLMHSSVLMKYHALHHSVSDPPPLATFYCSTLEHLIVNTGTLLVPLIITPLPRYVNELWTLTILYKSIKAHMADPRDHHFIHHSTCVYNFGAKPFMDKLFGTFK